MSNPYVAYLCVAIAASKIDARTNGVDRAYARYCGTKAFNLARPHWFRCEEENCKPLYLFLWFFLILQVELAHTSSKPFSIGISNILCSIGHFYRPILRFLPLFSTNEDFAKIIGGGARRLTEEQIHGHQMVQQLRALIVYAQISRVCQADCETLVDDLFPILHYIQRSEEDSQGICPDPIAAERMLFQWLAVSELHTDSWALLKADSNNEQHMLWWILLANWGFGRCRRESSVWYLKDVGEKIVRSVVDKMETGPTSLTEDPVIRAAMSQAVKVLGKKW